MTGFEVNYNMFPYTKKWLTVVCENIKKYVNIAVTSARGECSKNTKDTVARYIRLNELITE